MRHLWTVVTTANTVTHDAGVPEWLDVPASQFIVPPPSTETDVMEVELNPTWYLATSWAVEADDIGRQLYVAVRYFDPGNRLLHAVPLMPSNGEVYFTPEPDMVGSDVPITAEWGSIWYTEPGRYTFEIQWLNSLATREVGRFSVMLTHLNGEVSNE